MKKNIIILFLLCFALHALSQHFRFIQWADPQLGFVDFNQELSNTKKSILKINELNPDFVLICGDMIHAPSDSSLIVFKNTLKSLKMPVYFVPGNHDLSSTNDENLRKYRKYYGHDFSRFSYQGVEFILLNTQLWKRPHLIETKKQEDWLKKSLSKAYKQNKSIVVVGHIPLFLKNTDEVDSYDNLPIQTRKEILNLFDKNNVSYYLSGHLHYFLENRYNNINFVTAQTTSKNFDKTPVGFLLWTVNNKTFSRQFIDLN